jgi:hypothetical protein
MPQIQTTSQREEKTVTSFSDRFAKYSRAWEEIFMGKAKRMSFMQ